MLSWPFGKKKTPGDAALEAAVGDAPAKASGPWDPSGLERAAKAVRELNSSPHAERAYDVVLEQERTKQHDLQLRQATYELQGMQHDLQRVQAEAEEARKTLKMKTERANQNADYADRLERERYMHQTKHQQALRAQELEKQEKAFEEREKARRETIKHQSQLEMKRVLAKVQAEVSGKIEQERANHDLILAKTKAEGAETRQTRLESIKLATETFGAGVREFLVDRERMTAAVGLISAVALGVYGARVSTGVAGRYIEARLGKPSLVRETSRTSLRDALRAPVPTARRALGIRDGSADGSDALEGVVLEPRLDERLRRVATATFNTKRNRAPFRHLLLHGPPGTGKTLFAKGLAKHSGLEYAILTGGDVAPLGRDGVTEVHKLFEWARTSRRGLLLFIDEADAFLRQRSVANGELMSEDLRNALNAFLYRTGEASDKFMLVYASNQPEQFDWAINDRIDEMVEFMLPGEGERDTMIRMYIDKYLKAPPPTASARRIVVDESLSDAHVAAAVDATNGFSGREISKLAIAWQAAAYGSAEARFTPEIMASVLEVHVDQRERKRQWSNPKAASVSS